MIAVEFLCEDLPQYGLVLVPPASTDYAPLLADIQRRLDKPAEGTPPIPETLSPRISEQDESTSAILLNKSPKTIAAMQVVWSFETMTGRSYRHSRGMLSVQSLLLPFRGPEDSLLKLLGYWHSILPGSKRYLCESGMVGDNTDVRPPASDEKWPSGGGRFNQSGRRRAVSGRDLAKITLVLDGVFFLDGEFVGPNREKLFEQTVAEIEAHTFVAKIAHKGRTDGLPPEQVLAEIEKTCGPAPENSSLIPPSVHNPDATPDELRWWALQRLARHVGMRRKFPQFTDEGIVNMIMGWAEAVLPHFRKG